ncbi:helix-turn-helix domain-containing protein [Streptococcus suis]|nr:helix-turn-helix domain-containing protein [Streptococcus suis]
MYEEDWKNLFPTARVVDSETSRVDWFSFALPDGQFLQVPKTELTDREMFLLSLLGGERKETPTSPWFAYFHQSAPLPKPIGALQLLHVHVWNSGDQETIKSWLTMMKDLLMNTVAVFQQTQQEYIFVLDQELRVDIEELVRSILPVLEDDFGLKLTIFMGQIWPKQVTAIWREIFQAESALFTSWKHYVPQPVFVRFSQLLLWIADEQIKSRVYLKSVLRELIHSQDGLEEAILALWKEGAVVTKTAQRLYIHRNTLQYRLEKWQDLTGFQLKELTDLTVCYQAIMEQQY